jgi:hypothetical protein
VAALVKVAGLVLVGLALAVRASANEPEKWNNLDPPAAAAVSLRAEPATLVLGQSDEADVTISITGPGPAVAAPPRIFVNIGTIDPVRRVGDRAFVTRFRAPTGRFPKAALIGAETADSQARGFVILPIAAPAEPAFRTEAGGKVTVLVGEARFGPVVASSSGEARVPIVVPPGVATATVELESAQGKRTVRDLDLRPPHFPLLLLFVPESVPAGGIIDVAVVGIDPRGRVVEDHRLVLRSSFLRPHPLGTENQITRYLVRVPPRLDAGPLRLIARLRRDDDLDDEEDLDVLEAALSIEPGPLAKLSLLRKQSRLVVRGDDLWGHEVPVENAEIFINGRPARLDRVGPDNPAVVFEPGAAPPAGGPIEVEAVLDGVYARYHIPAASGAPPVKDEPAARVFLTPAIGMLRAPGAGYGLTARVQAEAASPVLPAPVQVGVVLGYLGARGHAGDTLGESRVSLDQLLLLARARWCWWRGRLTEAALAAGAGLAYTRVRSRVFGLRLTDHQAGPAAELAAEGALLTGPGALTLGLRYVHAPVGTLPSGDEIDAGGGNLAFDVGYRVRF